MALIMIFAENRKSCFDYNIPLRRRGYRDVGRFENLEGLVA
jgi:hypothetical protein